MELGPAFVALLVAPPVILLVLFAAYAYVDAPDYGMDPTKWAAISFFVPFFGFFAYLFERDEATEEPDEERFTEGVFEIHESRAGETRLPEGGERDRDDDGPER